MEENYYVKGFVWSFSVWEGGFLTVTDLKGHFHCAGIDAHDVTAHHSRKNTHAHPKTKITSKGEGATENVGLY